MLIEKARNAWKLARIILKRSPLTRKVIVYSTVGAGIAGAVLFKESSGGVLTALKVTAAAFALIPTLALVVTGFLSLRPALKAYQSAAGSTLG